MVWASCSGAQQMDDNGQYYRRRMEAELQAAECCEDVSVAQIHRALADGYRRLIEENSKPEGERCRPELLRPLIAK